MKTYLAAAAAAPRSHCTKPGSMRAASLPCHRPGFKRSGSASYHRELAGRKLLFGETAAGKRFRMEHSIEPCLGRSHPPCRPLARGA
jgi:hypothetical protein